MTARRLRHSPKQGLLIALLVAIAVLTYWLPHHRFGPAAPRIHPPAHADFYARDALMTITGADGQPLYRIHSREVLHYPDHWTTLHQVRVTYFRQAQPPWHTRADRARIPPSQRQIRLFGHVVSRARLANGNLLTMTTPRLTVFPDRKRMRSDARVKVVNGARRTEGVGMRANLNTQHVEFLSDVHSTYLP